MSKSQNESEVVLYVGIALHDPAFRGLPTIDRAAIHDLAHKADPGARQFRPILCHGNIVGYGIPIIIADRSDEFHEIAPGALYETIERARHTVAQIATRVRPPFEPKLYAPQLFHGAMTDQ
jgi:hypothetical protein